MTPMQRKQRAHQSDDNETFQKLKAAGLENGAVMKRAAS